LLSRSDSTPAGSTSYRRRQRRQRK
jgi:hypothetical protein